MANQLVLPPTLSRHQSASFLLEPQRLQGPDLVAMLHLIGFPGAQDLKGADFDWLCEISEEVQHFLAWLCEVVDQRKVLSSEQLEAYNALLDSGQPILEADELQNLCKSGDKGDTRWEMEDKKSLNDLEAKLQSLQSVKSHLIKSRNKIESLALALAQKRLSLDKLEKELEKTLNNTKDELYNLNSTFNSILGKLVDLVTEIGKCHSAHYPGNIFFSLADVEEYISFEETCWKKIEDAGKAMTPILEKEMEKQNKVHRELDSESNRLQTAWASKRLQLAVAVCNLHGNLDGMFWLEKYSGEQICEPMHLMEMDREIQSLEIAVETLQTKRLPLLACEAALGLCLEAQNGWVDTERKSILKIGRTLAPLIEGLVNQMSRLQLVEVSLQREMDLHQTTDRDLRNLKDSMGLKAYDHEKRIQSDPKLSSPWLRPLRMDSKDHTALRLSLMLLHPSKRKDIFPKYEALQRQAVIYAQELMSLSVLFHEPLPKTISLEHSCGELHRSLCRGTRTLQLRDPSFILTFETLASSVSQFNQWILDFFHELERKKQAIQTSYMEQGRQLYVHFYRDSVLLARMVEDLEQRVADLH